MICIVLFIAAGLFGGKGCPRFGLGGRFDTCVPPRRPPGWLKRGRRKWGRHSLRTLPERGVLSGECSQELFICVKLMLLLVCLMLLFRVLSGKCMLLQASPQMGSAEKSSPKRNKCAVPACVILVGVLRTYMRTHPHARDTLCRGARPAPLPCRMLHPLVADKWGQA